MGWPDLTALELLVEIDHTGSLRSAGKRAGIAQPNVSRTIAQLERDLRATLVRRTPRGSSLTAHGTVIAHLARQVLSDARELLDAANALHVADEPTLSIAASMTVAEYLLPAWLARFRRESPSVRVQLDMINSAQVCERVHAGTYDLGFIESPSAPAELHKMAVARDRLVVVVEPAHAWARRRRPVTAAELARTPLITREIGSGTRDTLDAALHDLPRAAPLLQVASSAAIRASVLAGVGPAVLSSVAVRSELRAGVLSEIEVHDLDLHRTLWATWRPPRLLEGPAAALLAMITRGGLAERPPGEASAPELA